MSKILKASFWIKAIDNATFLCYSNSDKRFQLNWPDFENLSILCVMIIHNKGKYGDVLARAKEISLCIKVHIYRLNNTLKGIKKMWLFPASLVLPKAMYKRFGFIYSTK